MSGEVSILNVGHGDTKISFDKANPGDVAHARAAITSMIRSGFSIMVPVGEKDGKPVYMRADRFDPETDEYVIVGHPNIPDDEESASKPKRGRKKKGETRVSAAATNAVAIGRTSGG